jgi:hypothetical protein
MLKLIFPYTFAPASGLLPAQFSYTGTMIRTVDSYYSILNCMNATAHMDDGQRYKNFFPGLSPKTYHYFLQFLTLLAIPNP